MKKSSALIFAIYLTLTPTIAFAQTSEATTAEATPTVAQTTPTVTTSPKLLKSEIKSSLKTTEADLKEKMMAARDAFKARIQSIKDEKKKAIAESIDTRIQSINEKRTTQMLEYIDKLAGILTRISTRTSTLKSQGKDTAALEAKLATATTALEAAKTKVTDQAAKTYTATITTDGLLKSAFGKLILTFKTDIKAAFDSVQAAKKAVRDAHVEEAKLSGEGDAKPTVTTAPAVVSPTTVPGL